MLVKNSVYSVLLNDIKIFSQMTSTNISTDSVSVQCTANKQKKFHLKCRKNTIKIPSITFLLSHQQIVSQNLTFDQLHLYLMLFAIKFCQNQFQLQNCNHIL